MLLAKVAFFFFLFEQFLTTGICEDLSEKSLNKPANINSKENPNFSHSEADNENSEISKRSKRDDTNLDDESEYYDDDDNFEENQKMKAKEKENVAKVSKENPKSSAEIKKSDSKLTKSADKVEPIAKKSGLLETPVGLKRELEEKFEKELNELREEFRREIAIRHPSDRFLGKKQSIGDRMEGNSLEKLRSDKSVKSAKASRKVTKKRSGANHQRNVPKIKRKMSSKYHPLKRTN